MGIAWLKRYITDNVAARDPAPAAITRKEKIAVIGAGPAGPTAARDLTMRGYAVTVFEELPDAGGMLRYGIPEYRLPRETLKEEMTFIAQGMEIKTLRVGNAKDFARIRSELRLRGHGDWRPQQLDAGHGR